MELRQTILESPTLWTAYEYLGHCYMAKGNRKAAAEAYRKACDLNPTDERIKELWRSAVEGS